MILNNEFYGKNQIQAKLVYKQRKLMVFIIECR